jgi:hypothetical protein
MVSGAGTGTLLVKEGLSFWPLLFFDLRSKKGKHVLKTFPAEVCRIASG